MSLPLEVLADLQLAVDGENVDIQANGDRIVVDLPSFQAGKRILEAEPISRRLRTSSDRVQRALAVAGLTLEVQLQGDPILVVGSAADPSRFSRLLRLDGVELRLTPTLRQAVRQRPILSAAVVGGLFVLAGWIVARFLQTE